MVEDARYRTKDYLEGITNPNTALNNANLTKDDGTQCKFIVAYGFPDYSLLKVFKTKGVDLVFSIGEVGSEPAIGHDQKTYGYNEHVPITPCCINKTNITATKLLQKARAELRRIFENYPLGSLRQPVREAPETERLGSTILYKFTAWLDYRRGTT